MLKSRKNVIKKVSILFVLIITLTVLGVGNVLGEGGSSAEPAPGSGPGLNCSNCTCAYQPDSYVYGVRISLVYWSAGKNNKRVENSHSIDVFESSTLRQNAAGKGIYIYPGDNTAKYNRVDMIQKISDSYPTLEKTTWDSIPKVLVDQLEWEKNGIPFNYGSTITPIDYSLLTDTLYAVMEKEVEAYAASDYKDKSKLVVTTKLFSALGVDFTKYTKEQFSEMHLMLEPITAVAVKGVGNMEASYNLFYGTITQVAAAFPNSNCNSDNASNWRMSDSLVNLFGIGVYATTPCNTAGDMKYCVLDGWEIGSNDTSSHSARRNSLIKGKKSNGMGLLWLGGLDMPPAEDCSSVVDYLNSLYGDRKITQTQYDAYIEQVKNGTFYLEDTENNKIYKIEQPQEYEFLIKENYDKFNRGQAACANREKMSLDCEAAVNYINSSSDYPKGSQKYHDAIAQVRAGTFSYELYDGTVVKIDEPYSYEMLKKAVYTRQGGVAACKDLPDSCTMYEEGTVEIDDCETGKSYFKDIDDEVAWLVCEIAYGASGNKYSSDNTGHDAVETPGPSGRGGVVGNAEYCEVFCYEEVETTFPTHVYGVKAGQTFTWGTSDIFGTINVKKVCKTQNYVKGQQGYRFEEWENTYKANERSMIEHYMKNAAYEKMKNNSNITISSDWYYTDCCGCCVPESCGTNLDGTPCTTTVCIDNCEPRWTATASASGTSHSYTHGYLSKVTGTVDGKSETVSGYLDQETAEANAKKELLATLDKLAAEEEFLYGQGLDEEQRLLDVLSECTNSMDYVYETTIQFIFKEPVNSVYGANSRSFEFNDNLIREETVNPDASSNAASACKQVTIYRYTCSGVGSSATCKESEKKVWDCRENGVKWESTGVYTYKYPTEYFQWYTLKTDSTLVNENKKGSEDPSFFYSVGFGLPTALSLTNGTYELKAVVYDIGDKATITGGNPLYERPEDTHFDPLGLNVSTNLGTKKGFEYICTYVVENEIFGYDCQYDENGKLIYESPEYCDPDKDKNSEGSLLGIDITYRLVTLLSDGDTLDKAFPSREGDGREPGINWQLGDEELREILDADVYNEPAMYEIMLDVNAIQTIREDNQAYFNAGKDPYASYYDANNAQKVYCATSADGNEKYCASDFISNLYNGSGLNYRLLGTCLPTGNTFERAEYILENGCDTHYTYPTINWKR